MKARDLILSLLVSLFPIIAFGQNLNDDLIAAARKSNTASLIAADGRLYFAGEDGDVFVVKAGPKYELIATKINPSDHTLILRIMQDRSYQA